MNTRQSYRSAIRFISRVHGALPWSPEKARREARNGASSREGWKAIASDKDAHDWACHLCQ